MKGKRDQDKRLVYVVNDPLEEFYALDTQSHEQDVDFL